MSGDSIPNREIQFEPQIRDSWFGYEIFAIVCFESGGNPSHKSAFRGSGRRFCGSPLRFLAFPTGF